MDKILKIKLALFLSIILSSSYCQKVYKSSGKAIKKVEVNETKEQAKAKVKELAIIKAIENKFDSYVNAGSRLEVKNGRSAFTYIGSVKVLGEWLKTTDVKFTEDSHKTESGIDVYITCCVEGKVRAVTPKAVVKFEVLNMPKVESRTTDFLNNEQLYLQFISPVDGYVSVFLEEGGITRRLLPYSKMGGECQNGVLVKGDSPYLFFSENHSYWTGKYETDEIILYTNKSKEENMLYIIFSEKEYKKPILNPVEKKGKQMLPKSLKTSAFKKWLTDCKINMPEFVCIEKKITIKNE